MGAFPPEMEHMFAEGVRSVAADRGMSEKDAEAFVSYVCKEAASGKRRYDDDDDDEEDTWWGRNKSWLIPTLVGTGAFLVGADAGRNGRPDRSYLSNAGSLLWHRVKKLVGMTDDPLWKSISRAQPVSLPDQSAQTSASGDFFTEQPHH